MNLTQSPRWHWQAWSAGKCAKSVLTVSMRLASPLSARCANTGNSAPWMSDTSVTYSGHGQKSCEVGTYKVRWLGTPVYSNSKPHLVLDTGCCRAAQDVPWYHQVRRIACSRPPCSRGNCADVRAYLIVVSDIGAHPGCKVEARHLPHTGATASHIWPGACAGFASCKVHSGVHGLPHSSLSEADSNGRSIMHTHE